MNVGHRYKGGPWLFRSIQYAFEPGKIYALTGPSGSGKSTLLSILAGLEKPSEGSLAIERIERRSWVFQNPFGAPRRSAIDHVSLPLLARGLSVRDAHAQADDLLRDLGLGSVRARAFRELSGGEAQRLMLARGIAADPDLLLVDEPTAQLDRRSAATVDAVLGALAVPHRIVIIATHDPNTRDACTDQFDLGEHLDCSDR